jgi:hypothetical protein
MRLLTEQLLDMLAAIVAWTLRLCVSAVKKLR